MYCKVCGVVLLTACRPDLAVGSKKDRHGCEVLTLMLQALQSIVASEALPADKILVNCRFTNEAVNNFMSAEHINGPSNAVFTQIYLRFRPTQVLFEATVNGISQRVLGSASYQVGKLDVLNVSSSLFR